MRCEKCQGKMSTKGLNGRRRLWTCPGCDHRYHEEVSEQESSAALERRRLYSESYRKARSEAKENAARAERGEAPLGEDVDLWSMRQVMEQEADRDRGPRQKFYRTIREKHPLKFAAMLQEAEARVRKETRGEGIEIVDAGLEKSLSLAEALLKEIGDAAPDRD